MAAQHGAMHVSRSDATQVMESSAGSTALPEKTLLKQGLEWLQVPRNAAITASVAIIGAGFAYFSCRKWLEEQLANPDRSTFFGRRAIQLMQDNNTRQMEYAVQNVKQLANVEMNSHASVVEVGFGIGDGLRMLADAFPHNQIVGVDHSQAMVQEAQAQLVPKFGGRLSVAQADVCRSLGVAPDSCGIIFNMNCVYFWEDLDSAVQVLRAPLQQGAACFTVMKPAAVADMVTDNFKHRNPVSVGAAFAKAGFQVTLWSQAADGALTEHAPPSEDAPPAASKAFESRMCKLPVVIVQAVKQ